MYIRYATLGTWITTPTVFLAILMINSVKGNVIKDREEILTCFPEKPGNFSSKGAEAVIYDIVDETKQDGAAIFCSISDKMDRYAKMELTLYGEPPNQLTLEAFSDTLLRLEKSRIYCCTKDVFERNRQVEDLERYHLNMTGVIRYKCDGMPRLSIDLAGLELISKDLSKIVHDVDQRDVEETKDICVTEGKRRGSTRRLGKPCNCLSRGCIEMYDENGNFTCAKCCAHSYWRLDRDDSERVKGVCKKCGHHFTNPRPNTRTGCSRKRKVPIPLKTTTKPQTTTPSPKPLEPPTIKPSEKLPTDITNGKTEQHNTIYSSTQASTIKPTQPPKITPASEEENDATPTTVQPETTPDGRTVGVPYGFLYALLFVAVIILASFISYHFSLEWCRRRRVGN